MTVHVIPHSHEDVGWLKSYNDYYTGANNDIFHARNEQILTTVTEQLMEDPEKVFTYVEMKYFCMWYER